MNPPHDDKENHVMPTAIWVDLDKYQGYSATHPVDKDGRMIGFTAPIWDPTATWPNIPGSMIREVTVREEVPGESLLDGEYEVDGAILDRTKVVVCSALVKGSPVQELRIHAPDIPSAQLAYALLRQGTLKPKDGGWKGNAPAKEGFTVWLLIHFYQGEKFLGQTLMERVVRDYRELKQLVGDVYPGSSRNLRGAPHGSGLDIPLPSLPEGYGSDTTTRLMQILGI